MKDINSMPKAPDVSYTPRYYVYMFLSLKDGKFYIGFTNNLKRRLQQHARGEVKSTKHRRPLKLIFYEYFTNKFDAKAREVFLKSGFGRRELRKALKATLNYHKLKVPYERNIS